MRRTVTHGCEMDFQTHMSVMLHLGGTVCYFVISIVIAK